MYSKCRNTSHSLYFTNPSYIILAQIKSDISSIPSDVQLSELSAPSSVAALSASQIEACLTAIKAVVAGKTLADVLSALPGLVESTYVLVQSYLGSDSKSISTVVLSLLQSGLGMSGLPAADIAVLDKVLESTLPAIIALVGKYLPEVEEEVEQCCSGCWKWLKSKV